MPVSRKRKVSKDLQPYIQIVQKALKEEGVSLPRPEIVRLAKDLKARRDKGELE